MASLATLPNELLDIITRLIVDCADHEQLVDLAAVARTCQRLNTVATPILYSHAILRHPYLLAWAAETGNSRLLTRLLALGMSPNTEFTQITPFLSDEYSPRRAVISPRLLFRDHYAHTLPTATLSPPLPGSAPGPISPQYTTLGFHVIQSPAMPLAPLSLYQPAHRLPLHLAAAAGQVECIRLLLAAGAFLEVPSWRFCPADDANDSRADDPCQSYAAQPVLSWSWVRALARWTPLYAALQMGHDEARLMEEEVVGAEEANGKDVFGASLLWTAYLAGNVDTIEGLVRKGADVDESRESGYTPLMDACKYGRVEIVRVLLDLGADLNVLYTGPPDQVDHSDNTEDGDEENGDEEVEDKGEDEGEEEAEEEEAEEEEPEEEEPEEEEEWRDADEESDNESDIEIQDYTPLSACACLFNPKPFFRRGRSQLAYLKKLPTSDDENPVETREKLGKQLVTLLLDREAEFESSLDFGAGAHDVSYTMGRVAADPKRDDHYKELLESLRKHGILGKNEGIVWDNPRLYAETFVVVKS
ncbi:hypothetical protein N0V88_006809 [Collariella sp. IMI 366227]|nr:hypothetical protein N0V88_006809 [Collariella sp. IMI 366227]